MSKRKRPTQPSCFESQQFLQTRLLNLSTAIEYFALSPHYKTTSLQHKIFTGELTWEQIKPLEGIIYRVSQPPSQPPSNPPQTFPLFIIHEEYQKLHQTNKTLQIYYISDGKIYTAPSLQKVLRSRADKALNHLEKAISFFADRAVFNVTSNGWKWEEKEVLEVIEDVTSDAASSSSSNKETNKKQNKKTPTKKKKRRKPNTPDVEK